VKPANAEIRPGVAGIAVARFVGLKDVLQTDRHAYFCHLVSVGGITLQILTPSLLKYAKICHQSLFWDQVEQELQ
jgi:hypothetical protein